MFVLHDGDLARSRVVIASKFIRRYLGPPPGPGEVLLEEEEERVSERIALNGTVLLKEGRRVSLPSSKLVELEREGPLTTPFPLNAVLNATFFLQ